MITKKKGVPRGRGGGRPKGPTGTAGVPTTLSLSPEARAVLAGRRGQGRWVSGLIVAAGKFRYVSTLCDPCGRDASVIDGPCSACVDDPRCLVVAKREWNALTTAHRSAGALAADDHDGRDARDGDADPA